MAASDAPPATPFASVASSIRSIHQFTFQRLPPLLAKEKDAGPRSGEVNRYKHVV
jgi:hypothetical protein